MLLFIIIIMVICYLLHRTNLSQDYSLLGRNHFNQPYQHLQNISTEYSSRADYSPQHGVGLAANTQRFADQLEWEQINSEHGNMHMDDVDFSCVSQTDWLSGRSNYESQLEQHHHPDENIGLSFFIASITGSAAAGYAAGNSMAGAEMGAASYQNQESLESLNSLDSFAGVDSYGCHANDYGCDHCQTHDSFDFSSSQSGMDI